jgi:uncharacterized membrane protein YeaQ/YmgE (transglycosylase-associated protein family)
MLLGVVGALVATRLAPSIGWYQGGRGAGFIGAVVGAVKQSQRPRRLLALTMH